MKNKILLLISTWSLLISPVFGQTVTELVGASFAIDTRDSESEEWLVGGLFEVDTRDRIEFSLSSNTVSENQSAGIEVGSFRSSSANQVGYSLVPGEGSGGNDHFTLSPHGILQTAKVLDYERTQEYSIRVLATASGSVDTEKVFTVDVLDVDEPTNPSISLSSNTVNENLPIQAKVGEFSMRDGQSASFKLVKGEGDSGNRFFSLTPEGELRTAMILDAEKSPSLSIRVQASQAGYETTGIFEIRVNENEILPPPEDPTKWKKKWEEEMAKLSAIRQEIEDTNKSILEVDETLTRQTEEIRNLESQITEIEEAKLACDTECAQVREENESKKAGLEQIRMENQRAENRISGLEDDLGKWITMDSELSEQITQKRTELTGLEEKLRIPYLRGWHYTAEQGWLWTDFEFYPMVYSDTQGIWLEYAQGSSDPWQYYDHYSQQWQEWK